MTIQYRVVQTNERRFVVERKDGWFWWRVHNCTYAGFYPAAYETLEGARERIKFEQKADAETIRCKQFKPRVWECKP